MKKWKTSKYENTIVEVEVVKETEHFVTVKQGLRERVVRENKNSVYHKYHDSWEAARDHLLDRAKRKRDYHAKLSAEATDEVIAILEMTSPEVTA